VISHFIVLTTFGQIFFSKEFGEESGVDVALTGGLISAVYSMTTETQREKITQMALEDKKIIFREREQDLLFVLTVDELMDDSDANEILDEIADRFFEKYGEVKIDGMILTDFEPVLDEIIEQRLWYSKAKEKLTNTKWDTITTILLAFTAFWYTAIAINMGQLIYHNVRILGVYFPEILPPYETSLVSGLRYSLFSAFYIALMLLIPGALSFYAIRKAPGVRNAYRFAYEFFRRPTRSGYTRLLPKRMMLPIFHILAVAVALTYYGRVIIWELQSFPLSDGFLEQLGKSNPPVIYWSLLIFVTLSTFLTWIFLQPLIMTGFIGILRKTFTFDRKFYLEAVHIATLSSFTLIPYMLWASMRFQEILGFHPNIGIIYEAEKLSITFLITVFIPLNLFFFSLIFYLGIGLSRLIIMDRLTYAFSLAISVFSTFLVQKMIFWFIFQSGYIYQGL